MPESLCLPTDRAARCPKEVFAGLPPVEEGTGFEPARREITYLRLYRLATPLCAPDIFLSDASLFQF